MTDDTMTQFRTEGQPAFPVDTEKDNSAASSTGEKTDGEQTPPGEGEQTPPAKSDGTEEDKDGFQNHPAWN